MKSDLQIRQVEYSYFNGTVLHNITIHVKSGEMVGLLGPNGSGKTTLIKLASGVLKPNQGDISLDGSSLSHLSRKFIARNIAVVPQQFHVPFAFTVNEIVMLGRIPFVKAFTEESETDRQAVNNALGLVAITELQRRRFEELSGGERQKVILAMALAQQPRLILLDEPIVHLDISHQLEILELLRNLNAEQSLTVIAAMHDLNLASLYFNRLVLLKEGRVMADGTPAQVLTEAMIQEVFSTLVKVEPHPVAGVPHIIVTPKGSITDEPLL